MIRAKNCEKLSIFVEVMTKIPSDPFFPDIVSDMGSDMSVSHTRDIQRQRMA